MCKTSLRPFDEPPPPVLGGGGVAVCNTSWLPYDRGTTCQPKTASCQPLGEPPPATLGEPPPATSSEPAIEGGIESPNETLSSVQLVAETTCNEDKSILTSSFNNISDSSSHCDVSPATEPKVVVENVDIGPGTSSATATPVQRKTYPHSSTSKIFTHRTEDMTNGYLNFSKDDPNKTVLEKKPEDLTHLAPSSMPHGESTIVFSDLGQKYDHQQKTSCCYPPTTYKTHSSPVSIANENNSNQTFRISQRMSAECGVCATPFCSNVHNPRLLCCGHTICGACVAYLIKIRNFFCPFCRVSCRSIKSENELPLNHFILDLVKKENTDIFDNNNVNNSFKNLDKNGINESLNASNSAGTPSSIPVVHAGVCQEHGYYCDMRCTSCNVNICKQCIYCNHPQNTCRIISITNAKLENHMQFKEKTYAVMHNCNCITDNLLAVLPHLEAASKRQAKTIESLQSEIEYQQLLKKEVDDHLANIKDVLREGHQRLEVLHQIQQYWEDLESAQIKNSKEVDNINCEKQDDRNQKTIHTSANKAKNSNIYCSLSNEESSIISISNNTEESISNSAGKCCDSSTPELEYTLNLLDNAENYSLNVSDNPEEIAFCTTNDNRNVLQNSKNIICTTSNHSQILFDHIIDQATSTHDSTTDSTLLQNNRETDIVQIQITTLEDVKKIQIEIEHFIQTCQYLPWNRTASKLKKTQAIVSHAVEILDLCHTTQGYAPLVNGFLDDDYESEESEDESEESEYESEESEYDYEDEQDDLPMIV